MPIDFGLPFVPESFTPLSHTPAYARLTRDERRRYNQLYALYFNEQIIFFETSLAARVLLPLAASAPARLATALRAFVDEERRHTAMFRALNRKCAPAFYRDRDFYFIRVPRSYSRILAFVAARPRLFPMVLWLMLLQEERSTFYSRAIVESEDVLEPHFVAAHRAHLADECGHVAWDEDLLDATWDRSAPSVRRINGALFRWMVGEFFNTPKRGGVEVMRQLTRECPDLGVTFATLRAEVRVLARSRAYHESLYSREIVPRTFARFDRYPEFTALGRTLGGYDRAHADQLSPQLR
jgi:hypothetical protein